MFYLKRNLPWWERVLRAASSVAIIAAAVMVHASAGSMVFWLLTACAATLALSSIVGFCPACALFGRQPVDKTP